MEAHYSGLGREVEIAVKDIVGSAPWSFLGERVAVALGFGMLGVAIAAIYADVRDRYKPLANLYEAFQIGIFYGHIFSVLGFGFYLLRFGHFEALAGSIRSEKTSIEAKNRMKEMGTFPAQPKEEDPDVKTREDLQVKTREDLLVIETQSSNLREDVWKHSRWWKCKMCLVYLWVLVSMICPSLAVPGAAFFVMNWWAEASRSFTWCASQCFESLDINYIAACNSFGLTQVEAMKYRLQAEAWGRVVCPTCYSSALAFVNESEMHRLYDQMYHNKDECVFCFSNTSQTSRYVSEMRRKGNDFMAYESQFRRYYAVSVAEIYGVVSLLAALTLVRFIFEAMHFKEKELHRQMRHFLWSNLFEDSEKLLLDYYSRSFRHLDKLNGENMTWYGEAVAWCTRVKAQLLEEHEEHPGKTKARTREQKFFHFVNHGSLLQISIDTQEDTMSFFLPLLCGFLLALFHTIIPICIRLLIFHDVGMALSPSKRLQYLLGFSYILNIFVWTLVWSLSLWALNAYEAMRRILFNFDRMWRFPNENLMILTSEESERVRKVVQNAWHGFGAEDEGSLYAFDFQSTSVINFCSDLLTFLEVWCQMRRFLLSLFLGPRIKLELLSLIALLVMVPSVVIGVANLIVVQDTGQLANLIGSIVAFFDFGIGALFFWHTLVVSASFDSGFRNHHKQLVALKIHLSYLYTAQLCHPDRGKCKPENELEEQKKKVFQRIEAIEGVFQNFDRSMTFFGFEVNDQFTTRLLTLISASGASQLYPIALVLAQPFLKTA